MINYQSVGREYDFETLVFLYGGRLQNAPTQHTLKRVINLKLWQSVATISFVKFFVRRAFTAHTQLSLTFLHNIL